MSVERNKDTLRRIIEEGWNRTDTSVLPELIDTAFSFRNPLGEFRGPDGFAKMVSTVKASFPDIHYDIDEMIGEGDTICARVTWTGTHKGKYLGIPPTGKQVRMSSAFFFRFKDGKEVDGLGFGDSLNLFRQLGVRPPGF